jgi:hypothetical protein
MLSVQSSKWLLWHGTQFVGWSISFRVRNVDGAGGGGGELLLPQPTPIAPAADAAVRATRHIHARIID